MPPAPPLPTGFTAASTLSDRPGVLVLRATAPGGAAVVLRLDHRGGAEALAELAVLASVDHPGLARLSDFGPLPGGGVWVARPWIDGVDLATFAKGLAPEAIGALAVELARALDHLHRRGFVHGDVKPGNVLVDASGRAVLLDFGLARRLGERTAAAGTLVAVAPERLAGAPPEPAADLFALGATLVELLAARPDPVAFYARFPERPFLEAAGIERDALPLWSRDLIERLVARRPADRPHSADQVARTLAARLGLASDRSSAAFDLEPPVEIGREELLDELVATLGRAPRATWVTLPDAAEVAPFARALRLRAALAGRTAERLDPAHGSDETEDAAKLDRFASSVASAATAALVISAGRASAWETRRAEVIARAVRQAGRAVVVVSASAPTDESIDRHRAAPLDVEHLEQHLVECLHEPEPAAVRGLAERVLRAARGSTVRAAAELRVLARAGAFLAGAERPRLRPGELPKATGSALELPRTGTRTRDVAVALAVLGTSNASAVSELVGAETRVVAAELVELARLGLAERCDAARFANTIDPDQLVDEVGNEALTAMFARRAARLERDDSAPVQVHVARGLAGGAVEAALVAACLEQLDSGTPERVITILDELAAWRPLREPLGAAQHAALAALAWCALGQNDRARALLEGRESSGAAGGLVERALGRIAVAEHRTEDALAHLERSARLDPSGRAEAEVAGLHVLWELRRFDEIERRVAALAHEGVLAPGAWPERARANVASLRALAHHATGDGDRAAAELEALLSELGPDPATRAPVLQNLATVVRRSRGPAGAEPLLREAARQLEACGRVHGVAQVRTALGNTLRELGRSIEAEVELEAALATRERLGDRAGAALTRGGLGLVRAERGHLRAALADLDAAQRDLAPGAATRYGPLLRARAAELGARLGARPDQRIDEDSALDPREYVYRGRAAALHGETARGIALLERAASLARRLDLAPVREEAEAARRICTGELPPRPDGAAIESEDLCVARHVLAREPLEADAAAAALAYAHELAERGRDDRAARLALAVARGGGSIADTAIALAHACLARCEAGLSAREVLAARRALLGLPDPRPEDLERLASTEAIDEDDDMEFAELLDINHRLVHQEDQGALLGEIVEQALRVTGAERGFLVLEVDGALEYDTAIDSARGDIARPELEMSRSVARSAIERQETLRLSNASEDPALGAAPSVAQLELRSVLCAPFEVVPQLRGAIYVDHRLQSGAFGARAQRMLELLADQAALAIRQVRRLAEIRALNAQLSERVERQATDLEIARRSLRVAGLPSPAGGLVGDSPPMQQVRALIERVAPSELSVLVHGPSGTGKELAARALHELSDRAAGPFVTENCASLPESLIESELFGYERGAFTGADRAREGLFEQADGGTLFLDEIGEMPRELQSKLLRVLETREVRRLGDDRARPVDVRLVTATNRDLAEEVRTGRFREDLYYRVAGMAVAMPTLDERIEDVPALVEHFLAQQAKKDGVERSVSSAVLARLARRAWPGNVRELRNQVVRLCVLSPGDLDDTALVSAPGPALASSSEPASDALVSMEELERRAILGTIERLGGDKRKAAQVLGISLSKLYERLKRWRESDGSDESES